MTLTALVLKLALAPGDVRVYDVTRTYMNPERQETTVFRERVTWKVLEEVESGWFRVRRDRMPVEAVYDTVRVAAPEGTLPLVLHEERSARNTVRAIEPEPPDAHWMERSTRPLRVLFPMTELKVRDAWSHASPQDEARHPAWSATWTLKALDDKSATVGLAFTESEVSLPVAADGTIVFDRSSGWPVSVDVTVHNIRVPDDEEPTPVQLRVVWTLVDERLSAKG
jgi:hypothetical protein